MAGKKLKQSFNWTGLDNKAGVIAVVKILLSIVAIAVVVTGFAFLNRYVKNQTAVAPGSRKIELVGDVPGWVSKELINRVYAAATVKANVEESAENIAASVQRSVAGLVPWLDKVKVQTTYNSISITGKWRKPIAMITTGKDKFYIDTDLVVLDYMPITNLSVVAVAGLQFDRQPMTPGNVWQGDDLAAALAVLDRLGRMDATVSPKNPLLREIDKIDVTNFNGRKSKRDPHIILYTKQATQIIWGAEIDAWQRNLESPDDDKLAKLYTYYQQNKSLSGVKYINLRDPQQTVYLPIDKP